MNLPAVCALMSLLVLAFAGPVLAQSQTPSGPFAPEWGMLAGFDVFAKKGCGQCHAIRGAGGGPGPDLGRLEGATGFFDIAAAMWNHLPRMGATMRAARIDRPQLTPREASDLIAFLFTTQYWDEIGDAKAGAKVFAAKGCVACHAVGGSGGEVGPSLDPLKRANSPVLVAAAMWNHGPKMAETMAAKGMPRPTFQGREMVDLIAYVVSTATETSGPTSQVVPGTPERGEKLFAEKRCNACHAVGGAGPKTGPDLGRPGHHISLTRFAGRMWNHGPAMWAKMKEQGIDVPSLSGQDMADVLAYLFVSRYFDRGGSPTRGRKLLADRGCLTCHSLAGKGGTAAADFTRSSVVGAPAAVVAAMWNHSLLMEASAERQSVSWPVLKGSEFADLTAYLNSLARPPRPKPGGAR